MSAPVYTLFLGDLSIFCNENDIQQAFSSYGDILDIRIKRDEETGKNLSYGFIEYGSIESAVNAMREMNGVVLCGRPLRLRWGTNKNKNEPKPVQARDAQQTSSLHVTYESLKPGKTVSEETLRSVFSAYGNVIDATIKKASVNKSTNCQKGFGFIHYPNNSSGIDSAIAAVGELADAIFDDIHFVCSLSKSLQDKLNAFNNYASTGMYNHTPNCNSDCNHTAANGNNVWDPYSLAYYCLQQQMMYVNMCQQAQYMQFQQYVMAQQGNNSLYENAPMQQQQPYTNMAALYTNHEEDMHAAPIPPVPMMAPLVIPPAAPAANGATSPDDLVMKLTQMNIAKPCTPQAKGYTPRNGPQAHQCNGNCVSCAPRVQQPLKMSMMSRPQAQQQGMASSNVSTESSTFSLGSLSDDYSVITN